MSMTRLNLLSSMFGGAAACASLLGLGLPALADQPDAKFAQQTVFEVTVHFSDKQLADVVQPGFAVKKDGFAITSYNALHSAAGATAKFSGSPDEYKVELLTANPLRDLALIRLRTVKGGEIKSVDGIELGVGDLRNGQTVWSLQSSPSFDEAAAVTGIQGVSSQAAGGPRERPFDAPGWLYSEAHQDRHTCGCPLVDERRRLVGINVWSWPTAHGRPLGLTAAAVQELLDEYSDNSEKAKAKEAPAPTMTLDEARVKHNAAKRAGTVFPRLVWKKSAPTALSLAKIEATKLCDNVKCKDCDGSGIKGFKITEHDPNSPKHDGAKRERSEHVACPTCKASRFGPKEGMVGICLRVARMVAAVEPASEGYLDVVTSLRESAGNIARMERPLGTIFAQRVNESARLQLQSKRLKRGEAIMLVGKVSRNAVLSEWDKEVAVVTMDGDGHAYKVLAVAPDDAGHLGENQSALIIGVVSGTVGVSPDNEWTVLDRVTAVPLRAEAR